MKLTHFSAVVALIDYGILRFNATSSRPDLLRVFRMDGSDTFSALVALFDTSAMSTEDVACLLYAICIKED